MKPYWIMKDGYRGVTATQFHHGRSAIGPYWTYKEAMAMLYHWIKPTTKATNQ